MLNIWQDGVKMTFQPLVLGMIPRVVISLKPNTLKKDGFVLVGASEERKKMENENTQAREKSQQKTKSSQPNQPHLLHPHRRQKI